MIITASSMFGPGFVWLMRGRNGRKYSLLTTYLAGTPYPKAHYRAQPVDMNTEADDRSVGDVHRRLSKTLAPVNTVGSHGPHSKPKLAAGGLELTPILCINMWEHVYLPDYGVGANGSPGKRGFAENWWYAIDWAEVANNAEARGSEKYL